MPLCTASCPIFLQTFAVTVISARDDENSLAAAIVGRFFFLAPELFLCGSVFSSSLQPGDPLACPLGRVWANGCVAAAIAAHFSFWPSEQFSVAMFISCFPPPSAAYEEKLVLLPSNTPASSSRVFALSSFHRRTGAACDRRGDRGPLPLLRPLPLRSSSGYSQVSHQGFLRLRSRVRPQTRWRCSCNASSVPPLVCWRVWRDPGRALTPNVVPFV